MKVDIYTDGACSGNPGPGGAGFVLLIDGIKQTHGAKGYRRTTNNRMELQSVVEGLLAAYRTIKQLDGDPRSPYTEVTIYSDSQLFVNCINKGWGKKSNMDIWKRIESGFAVFNNVSVVKVKGHADNKYNNEADLLAVAGSKNPTFTDEVYEKENPNMSDVKAESVRPSIIPVPKPQIVNVHFFGQNTPDSRKIKIDLDNGTVVEIIPVHGGFEQCGCTHAEAQVTVDYANKYVKWLNGLK